MCAQGRPYRSHTPNRHCLSIRGPLDRNMTDSPKSATAPGPLSAFRALRVVQSRPFTVRHVSPRARWLVSRSPEALPLLSGESATPAPFRPERSLLAVVALDDHPCVPNCQCRAPRVSPTLAGPLCSIPDVIRTITPACRHWRRSTGMRCSTSPARRKGTLCCLS